MACNQFELEWHELIDLLSVHITTKHKKDVPLFSCAEYQFNGLEAVERDLKLIIGYHALVLDLDHCANMARCRYFLNKFDHIGYTSYSHCPVDHNFRTVMKVDRPFTTGELTKISPIIENLIFPEAIFPRSQKILDATCLHNNHWFYMPSTTSQENAEAWHSTGKVLEIDALLMLAKKFGKPKPVKMGNRQKHYTTHVFDTDPDEDRQRVMSCFDKHQSFVGYEPVWAHVCATMKSLEFSLSDFEFVTGIIMREKSSWDAQKKWRSVQLHPSPHIGFLFNVALGKHNYY
jgi:hypothetical protein